MESPKTMTSFDRDDIRRVVDFVKTAYEDHETRDAFRRALDRGRNVYGTMAGEHPKDGISRLARDARVQHEVGAFVRSLTGAVDATRKANRRSRRVWMWILAAVGLAGVAFWKTHSEESGGGDDRITVQSHETGDTPMSATAGT